MARRALTATALHGLVQAVLLAAVLALAGCQPRLRLSAIHDPLFRAIPHVSTIRAEAGSTGEGIQRITLRITRGAMADCGDLSVIPCRRDAVTFEHVCTFPGAPAEATCDYSENFGSPALVSYEATAVTESGRQRRTDEITYMTGFPSGVEALARPIFWHRTGPSSTKIDVAFFPDSDYLEFELLYGSFTAHLETVLESVYFGDRPFARTYARNRSLFNLWAAPFGADADGCSRSFDAATDAIRAVMDGSAILHVSPFRDCATISAGGAGSVFSLANDADFTFVHESGHFLFRLSDEYCCDGGYLTAAPCLNVHATEPDCVSYAETNGLVAGDCVEIGADGEVATGGDGGGGSGEGIGIWRIDNGTPEIMDDRDWYGRFRDASDQCVQRRFQRCRDALACY